MQLSYLCGCKWLMVCLLEKNETQLCNWLMCVVCKWLMRVVANGLCFFSFCCIFLHNFAYEITLFNYHAMLDWSSFWRCLCVDVFTALDVYLCDGFYCGNSFYVFNCCSYIYFLATAILCFSLYEVSGNKSNVRIKSFF